VFGVGIMHVIKNGWGGLGGDKRQRWRRSDGLADHSSRLKGEAELASGVSPRGGIRSPPDAGKEIRHELANRARH